MTIDESVASDWVKPIKQAKRFRGKTEVAWRVIEKILF